MYYNTGAPIMYRLAYGSYKAVGWVQLPVGANGSL